MFDFPFEVIIDHEFGEDYLIFARADSSTELYRVDKLNPVLEE